MPDDLVQRPHSDGLKNSLIPAIEDFDDPPFEPFADADAVFATDRDPLEVLAELRRTGPSSSGWRRVCRTVWKQQR